MTVTRHQQGLTLVELMIAMAIGLVVIAAVGNLFITTNKSVMLGDALSRNQETGRFALDYISNYARLAGFSEANNQPNLPLYVTSNSPNGTVNCGIAPDSNACAADNVDGIRGDRLSLPYFASTQQMTDCTGGLAGGANAAQWVVNVFWVDNEGILMCRAFDGITKDWIANAAPMLTGIETMEVLVGIAPNDESQSVSQYVNIGDVLNQNLNNRIRSLRVSILVSSDEQDANANKQNTTVDTRTYSVLDRRLESVTDGNLRHVFTTTIDLPNSRFN